MKAYVLYGVGDIRLEEVGMPCPGEGEALVRVCAAGVDEADIDQIYKADAPSAPVIPGHEFSGVVEDVGEGVALEWLHQRVGVSPLLPCGACHFCKEGNHELCTDYGYLGTDRDGGFAEFVLVPVGSLMKLPEGMSFEEAAMLAPLAIAVHAMRRVVPAGSDTVIVCGMNPTGIMIYMGLKAAGVKKVHIIGNGNSIKDLAERLSIPPQDCCDSRDVGFVGWLDSCTEGKGAEVVYECTGENDMLIRAVNMASPMGKICLVGRPRTDMKMGEDANRKLRSDQIVLEGSGNPVFHGGEGDDWHHAAESLAGKRIVMDGVVSGRYPLKDFMQGFQLMRDQNSSCGKIMMKII